jgi:hypothetical protein
MILSVLMLAALAKDKLSVWSAQATVARWDHELQSMPIWDGIEKQIRDTYAFYAYKADHPYAYHIKEPVIFGGDKNKRCMISLYDVDCNRRYWEIGLPEADFVRQHFTETYLQNKNCFYHSYKRYNYLSLFDHDGVETCYCASIPRNGVMTIRGYRAGAKTAEIMETIHLK